MASWTLRIPLRKWQEEALSAWRAAGNRGVAAVVTGGGKTIFAFACMQDLRRHDPGVRFVIVVPTVALMDQWALGLMDDLQVPPSDIAMVGGGRRLQSPKPVNLMVLNSARTSAPFVASQGPTMLVMDECHRAASEQNSRSLQGPHLATLGLSATPERDFDDLFQTVVEPVLGHKIAEYGYNDARLDGVISPFELINVRVRMTAAEQAKYDKLSKRVSVLMRRRGSGHDVEESLQRALRLRARISTGAHARLPTAVRLVERHRLEKAIVFHESIDAADILTATLRSRRHRVAVYHSGLGASVRQDNLRMFRSGEIDVLVTCRALDEGINVPNTSVAILVASTASTRQRIQRLGRVLRPAPGKDMSTVYTLYASPPEEDRLVAEASTLQGAESIRWLRQEAGADA